MVLKIISFCQISMPHWPQRAPLELAVLSCKYTRRFSASSFIDSFVQRSVRLFRFSTQPRHNNLFCNCAGFFLSDDCARLVQGMASKWQHVYVRVGFHDKGLWRFFDLQRVVILPLSKTYGTEWVRTRNLLGANVSQLFACDSALLNLRKRWRNAEKI